MLHVSFHIKERIGGIAQTAARNEDNMKIFTYVVKDEEGLHARPARLLVKEAEKMSSVIMVDKKGQKSSAKKIFGVMALGVKQGEEITVTVEGENETEDFETVKTFFSENL